MATVRNSTENQWILSTFGPLPPTSPTYNVGFLIGLYDPVRNDGYGAQHAADFVWTSGETSSYRHWGSGEPNNAGNSEYYAELVVTAFNLLVPGDWNDGSGTLAANHVAYGIVECTQPPSIALSTTSLDFGSAGNQLTFDVWNAGTGTLDYALSGWPAWVTNVAPASGTTTNSSDRHTHTITIDRSQLAVGANTATVTITSAQAANSPQTVQVIANQGTFVGPVSPSLSQVLVSPASLPADGQSAATVTVKLLDGNGHPVSGKVVRITAVEDVFLGGPVTLSSVTQPATPTDASGQAIATLTSAMAGTAIISAQDVSDSISLQSQPTVQFTSALVAPNSDLEQAITSLYQTSVTWWQTIGTVGTDIAAKGDQFRANIAEDVAQAGVDAAFGVIGVMTAGSDSIKYASEMLLPGLEKTGSQWLIEDSGKLSHLFDTQLLKGRFTSRVLDSAFYELVEEGEEELAQDVDEEGVQIMAREIAAKPSGLSQVQQQTAQTCQDFQQNLQRKEEGLLNQGIPPMSPAQQTAWANDLQLRSEVGNAWWKVLQQHDGFLYNYSAARRDAAGDVLAFLVAKFAVQAAATVLFDGPGALVTGGVFTLADEYQDYLNAGADQAGYCTAFDAVAACLEHDGEIYLNARSAYNELLQGLPADSVEAQIGPMTDWEDGYNFNGPSHDMPVYTVTNAHSLLTLTNTSAARASFHVLVLSTYSSFAYGVSIPQLPQVSIGVVLNVAPGAVTQVPVTYYDGRNGGIPDPSTHLAVYVLGLNSYGTFSIGSFDHTWNPTGAPVGMVRPLASQQEVENPVSTFVSLNPTNQTYAASIFVVNPFDQAYSAIVTQALPSGITVVATDGGVTGSAIVWTNLIPAGGLVKDSFTFGASFTPGASTNLPAATAIFIDETNNTSSLLSSVPPGFGGLFPVYVSGSVPRGIAGTNVPMTVTVTNWTSTNQTGLITVLVMDSAGVQVGSFALPFNLVGMGSTNLTFMLPGNLPPGSYSVLSSLSIGGGGGQVFAGAYVVPPMPVVLGGSLASGATSNGFTLTLSGQAGYGYLIEASTNLVDWQLAQYLVMTNSLASFTDYAASASNRRFYRAVQVGQAQTPVPP